MASKIGSRLLPQVVDYLAETDPERIFASFPIDSSFEDGTQDVTVLDLARAVNCCAWWIHNQLGNSDTFETISYVGTHDLAVLVMILATIKTGHRLFIPSPADSTETYLVLHNELDCNYLLTSDPIPSKATDLLVKRQMWHAKIPGIQHWLLAGDVKTYPYTKSYSQARQDPFVLLTTSGSTGTPKQIVLTHGTVAHHDLFCSLHLYGAGRTTLSFLVGKRVFHGMALFHSAGICFMALAIYANFTVVLPSAGPATAAAAANVAHPYTKIQATTAAANGAHAYANVQASFMPPYVVTEISRNAEYLENIKRLEYVTFGGTSLPRDVGTTLSKYVRVFVSFGATETGFYALEMTEPEDWEYAKPSALMGCDFRDLGSGLYELHLKRDKALEAFQGVFSTFPDKQEFTLNDVYSKHPTKANLWLYEGRSEDLIVLSNGVKINPLMPEAYIGSHPAVSGVLMTGSQRLRTALLIEPKMPTASKEGLSRLHDDIWPTVEYSYGQFVESDRIDRDLVLFTSPEKPMLRAGKGTIRRKVTLDLYRDELDHAFDKRESDVCQ